jgi:hypothetical protein
MARTDEQAAKLRARALAFENRVAYVPQPVGERLRATAARLRDQADKHDRTRITTDSTSEGLPPRPASGTRSAPRWTAFWQEPPNDPTAR